jgi:hypothetical protein
MRQICLACCCAAYQQAHTAATHPTTLSWIAVEDVPAVYVQDECSHSILRSSFDMSSGQSTTPCKAAAAPSALKTTQVLPAGQPVATNKVCDTT